MRLKLLASVVFSLSANQLAHAAVNAPISEVVLYPGSATIIRTVQVGVGNTQVEIAGLPARFDSQTLHAEATTGIVIGEIVTKDVANTEAISPNEANLEAKIQALQDQQAMIDAEIISQEIVKKYLEHLSNDSANNADKSGAPNDAKRLSGMIDTIGLSAKDALSKIQALIVKKREIQKQVDAYQRDLALQRTGDSDVRTVDINVSANRTGTIKLSYQIKNAGWKPAYRANLDSAQSKIDLDRLAIVSQKTGEDWSNIKLTLSTNQPNMSPTGPEPQPWLLTYHPPVPAGLVAQAYAPAPVAAPVQRVEVTGSSVKRVESDFTPPVFESQSTFSTQFDVPTRVNLLSDGREVTVTLSTQRFPVKQFVRVTPRLTNTAIVMAEAQRLDGVWLKGTMQLIRDGNYVGATSWNPNAKDNFVFSFGHDDLVKVEKSDIKNNTGSTGFLDKKSEYVVADLFSITNAHKTNVDIEVLESSPVSSSDEIVVKSVFDPKPKTETWSDRRGVVAWTKSLAPNETAKFTVNYTIDYPKEGSVSGLRLGLTQNCPSGVALPCRTSVLSAASRLAGTILPKS